MNQKEEKHVEKSMKKTKKELVDFFKKRAGELESTGNLTIADKTIEIPENVEVEYEFKVENGKHEFEIEIKWK